MDEQNLNESLLELLQYLIENSIELDPEFSNVVNKKFWEILA